MKTLGMAALVLSLNAVSAQASVVEYFSGFVGFGDSFSDKGRLGMLQPPSLDGRFSDGPTWMEILGAAFEARGQGNFNMALGGATAGPDNTNDPRYLALESITPRDPNDPDDIPFIELRNFEAQVDSFVDAGFDALVGDNPFVTVLFGGNDFLQNVLVNPVDVAADIRAGIEKVNAIGVQFDSFMVSTLPRFSISPGNADLTQVEKGLLDGLISGFNSLLALEMADLANDAGVEIEMFDLFGTFDAVYADAVADGLIVDEACTDTLTSSTLDPSNNCLVPGSSADYLFVDDAHPGSFAHSRIGAAALAQVEDRLVPVPVPASLPVLLAGVGLIVVLRRRRAA